MFRPSLFSGRTALVTGGGTGIGLAISKQLYNLGANVVIASRNEKNLKQAQKEIQESVENCPAAKNEISYQILDQRNLEETQKSVDNVIKNYDKLDFLVANGGGQYYSRFKDISPKGWNAVVRTNLDGTFNLCYSAYHAKNGMKDQQFGRIVTMSVSYINGGMYGMGHSGAARGGVENLTKTLAQEWAPDGIFTNCIAPGVIFSEKAADHYGENGRKYFSMIGQKAPARRLGTPDECAEAVSFLLQGGYINGVILPVDGGQGLHGITSQVHMDDPDF